MDSEPLPSQPPPAARAPVEQETAMDRARCDKAEIPDSPPYRTFPKASGAEARTPVIQIIDADPLAIKPSLVVPVRAGDASVAHSPPFFGVQAQKMGESFIGVSVVQVGSWQTSEPYQGKRANVVMLIGDTA